MFFRASTDGQRFDASCLKNSCAGLDRPAACWIIGSADNLTSVECEAIQKSNLPKFACNLSGRDEHGEWAIKPTHWTTFDPTNRFPQSIHLDPNIMKFYRESKTLDLIPNSGYKLCDAPNAYFFESELRSYEDYFGQHHTKINHSLDSFIQIMDIAFMLGFREMYLAGCEMKTRPSQAQIDVARSCGVVYDEIKGTTAITKNESGPDGTKANVIQSDLLSDFVREYARLGHNGSMDSAVALLESLDREKQYKFNETKSLYAAMSSDQHYFDRVQYLRLSRKNIQLNGLHIVTTSKTSRLAGWFPHASVFSCATEYETQERDDLKGLYSGRQLSIDLPFHRDISPYDWGARNRATKAPCGGCGGKKDKAEQDKEKWPGIIEELIVNPPKIDEAG